MSLTEKDRKSRSELDRGWAANNADSLTLAIAAALRREFGGSPGSVKRVVRLVHSNERAVKNWFDAKNGPSGANLIALMRVSDTVLEAVLRLAGRDELVTARRLSGAREKLKEMLTLLDDYDRQIGP